jgi:hypothetical protein
MPNTAVRAAAEGLPAITRRTMLRGLAALSASTGSAVAATGEIPQSEDAALLALGRELEAAVETYDRAKEAEHAALSHWKWLTPPVPEALRGRGLPFWLEKDSLRDPLGGLLLDDRGCPIMATSTICIDKRATRSSGRAIRKYLRELRPIAEAYEAAEEEARRASGIVDANIGVVSAVIAVDRLTDKVAAEPCQSLAGLVIKAQACLHQSRITFDTLGLHPHRGVDELARAVIEIAGAVA